ncbi:hypothetical protein L484_000795 [Morus notabilis]|uniref:Uncharacterized protein n=1 Tax=Morus notabilis TaxID=981085 RepID=W9RQ87_9ROSA|nr:hypothetical protein L484_000795 [Morus notabilis]
MYLEDFLLQNNNEYSSSPISSDYNESSLISDAGSSAINAKNFADNEENFDIRLSMNINRSCNGLSFKKRKTKDVLHDVALEDTASSPLNSPKVLNLVSQLGDKPKEKDYVMSNTFENKLGSASSSRRDERRDEQLLVYSHGKESDCTNLKKRGLCLVPLSMLVNYLG